MGVKIHKLNIDNRTVFVSQRQDTFKVIKPWKNEDGSINWFNLLTGGSWLNVAMTAFIVFIILGLLYEYQQNIQTFLDCFKDPMKLEICKKSFGPQTVTISYLP